MRRTDPVRVLRLLAIGCVLVAGIAFLHRRHMWRILGLAASLFLILAALQYRQARAVEVRVQ